MERQPDRFGQTIRRGEFELDGQVVDLLNFHGLAVDDPFDVWSGRDLWISFDPFPPEHDIVSGERLTVGPLQALAEHQSELLAV